MRKYRMQNRFLWILGLLTFAGCAEYTPKPHGYPKVEFPERAYQQPETDCPYQLTIPTYARLEFDRTTDMEKCWYNVVYAPFDATLHLTYIEFDNVAQLDSLTEDAYKLAMKHTIKATEIKEKESIDTSSDNLIMKYDLFGNTATPFMFYITDGKKHYLQGSFYFNNYTEADSVKPVFDFVKVDIEKMISDLKWKGTLGSSEN